MYLKTLQLRGFKSFASATTLEFEPGITCVVGPNGSGKSNVVDALSWVMGEQGVKTLRGGKMEDVIFAGTTSRPALGRTEVSLTIDNSDGALDIDYTEVTLTRTLFRNGGSEYAINGAQCRLLDIQDLLSDTGLGREMHVIVGQGQLDAVLRATPAERRGFIEEAAGVLKHRKRKEKALRKLDGMQGNLLRLQDLLTEIRRQLGPLARQAKAAQRAHTLGAAVRDSGLRLLGDDLETAAHELKTFLEITAERKAQLRTGEEELQSIEATLAQREHGAAVAGPQLSSAQVALTSLQSQREQLASLHTLATERLRHLGSASNEEIIDLLPLRDQLERLEVTAREANAQVEQARIQAANSAQAKIAGEQGLRLANQELAKYDQAAVKHRELIASLANQTSAHRSTTAALAQEIQRLQAERHEAKERLAAAQQTLGAKVDENDPLLDSEELESRTGLEDLTAQLSGAQERLGAAQTIHATTNSHLAGAVARAQALEMSLQHGYGDQGVLTEVSGVAGQVFEMFSAPEHLQPALAAVLGTLGSAVITKDQSSALKVADSEQAQELGTATVIHGVAERAPWDKTELERAVQQLHDSSAAFLLDQISVDQTGLPEDQEWLSQTLEQLLHKVVVVGTVGAATRLVALAPHAVGVTVDGHVVTQGQVRRWMPKETGPLRLRSELAAATQDIAERTEQLRALNIQIDGHNQEVSKFQSLLAGAQKTFERFLEQQHELAQKRVRIQTLLDNAAQEVERAAAKIAGAQTRLEHGECELATAAQKLGEAKDDVTGDPVQRAELEAAVHGAEEKLGVLRDQELEVRVALRGCQEQFAAHTHRVSATRRNLVNQERAVHRAKLANERRGLTAQRAQSVQKASEQAVDLIETSIATAKEDVDQALVSQQARDHEIGQLRTRTAQLHQLVRSHIDIVHKDDLKEAALAQQVSILEARAVEQYAMTPKDVVAQFGPHVPIEMIDDDHDEPQLITYQRSEQEENFAQAARKLANLGKINPLALEEFTALEERHEFLSTQLADLTSTRADLLSLVTDIDNRVEQAFAHAFEDTATQFGKVFGRLFPGGQGKLVLEEPDNPLSTGIEVEARPAGKQVKRLSLLSGGERSLTAIAFLVAIFLARPSPFYVMDEVEAALDDVNLGRLLAVFEELRVNSQLIIITHQKRTMGIADALYGVTMAGDGISTVISQRLETKTA